jgi:hypothetical protein
MKHVLAALIVVVALVASCVAARAAFDCLTLPQARAAHPTTHLKYRVSNTGRCWYASGSVSTRASARRRATSPTVAPASSAKHATVLYPTLIGGRVEPSSGGLAASEPITQWPRLIDIDKETETISDANNNSNTQDAADFCCWPPLDELTLFIDRWRALPSNWFADQTK